jgi:FkbM family methyltransferase
MFMATLRSFAQLLTPRIIVEGYRWARAPAAYRQQAEIRRVARQPRFVPTTLQLAGRALSVTDGPSAANVAMQIFGPRQVLRFDAGKTAPVIFDCGANVGITVMFWKWLYPQSRVIAFEPDPDAFACLRRNCGTYPDVQLEEVAVWIADQRVAFACDGADGGRLEIFKGRVSTNRIATVSAIRLKDRLIEPVDLLKMDIEGAEVDVLLDCRDRLHMVQRLFVEYHSFDGQAQRLDELLSLLRDSGMRICLDTSEHPCQRPFVTRHLLNGKDMHVNIFATREPSAASLRHVAIS